MYIFNIDNLSLTIHKFLKYLPSYQYANLRIFKLLDNIKMKN